jgi:uncharacterized protein with HEPN domain
MSFGEFAADAKTIDAVARNLEVIGWLLSPFASR